jgi:hypothetical protein
MDHGIHARDRRHLDVGLLGLLTQSRAQGTCLALVARSCGVTRCPLEHECVEQWHDANFVWRIRAGEQLSLPAGRGATGTPGRSQGRSERSHSHAAATDAAGWRVGGLLACSGEETRETLGNSEIAGARRTSCLRLDFRVSTGRLSSRRISTPGRLPLAGPRQVES